MPIESAAARHVAFRKDEVVKLGYVAKKHFLGNFAEGQDVINVGRSPDLITRSQPITMLALMEN